MLHNFEVPNDYLHSVLALHDMEYNVFPMPVGEPDKKTLFPWTMLKRIRLQRVDLERWFSEYRLSVGIMTGATSGGLFVIDCDNESTYLRYEDELYQRGITDFPVVKTHRGYHIYLRAAAGVMPNVKRHDPKTADDTGGVDFDLKGHDGYVLAPPSVHPKGGHYKPVVNWPMPVHELPTVTPRDLDFLRDIHGNPVKLRLKFPGKRSTIAQRISTLSRKTDDYLANGHTIPPDTERNERLFAALCDIEGNGLRDGNDWQRCIDNALASGLDQHEVDEAVSSVLSEPREPSRKTPLLTWQRAALCINRVQWKARTQDRAVFDAMVERCRVGLHGDVFRASTRELAEIARCTAKTVRASLQRLENHYGLVERAGTDKVTKAALWRFTEKCFHHVPTEHSSSGCVQKAHAVVSENVVDHITPLERSSKTGLSSSGVMWGKARQTAALERGALGHTGIRVLDTLLDIGEPASVATIAARAGLSDKQVRRALRTPSQGGLLRASGAITSPKRGLWQAEPHAASDDWLDKHIASQAISSIRRGGQIVGYRNAIAKQHNRIQQHMREKQVRLAGLIDARMASWPEAYKPLHTTGGMASRAGRVEAMPIAVDWPVKASAEPTVTSVVDTANLPDDALLAEGMRLGADITLEQIEAEKEHKRRQAIRRQNATDETYTKGDTA